MRQTKIKEPMDASDHLQLRHTLDELFDNAKRETTRVIEGAVDQHNAKAILDRIGELLDISQSASNRPLGAAEAAEYLGVSKSFLYHLTSNNEIGFWRSQGGGRLSFTRADLDKWRQGRYVPSRLDIGQSGKNDRR